MKNGIKVLKKILNRKLEHYFKSLRGKALCSGKRILVHFFNLNRYLESSPKEKKSWNLSLIVELEDSANVLPVAEIAQTQRDENKLP